MRSTQSTLFGSAAVLVLALTACGGEGNDDDSQASSTPTGRHASAAGSPTAAGQSRTGEATPTPVDPARFPPAAPGTELKVGEPAVIPFEDGDQTGVVQVTVTAIEKGAIEDLTSAGIDVKDEDRSATPYYVRATFKNVSAADLSHSHPTIPFTALDASDRNLGHTMIFGKFDKCEAPDTDMFTNGAEATGCKVYLAPPGATVASVTYDFVDLSADPVVWKP
ncbi:hypothetical protein [Yinghuangia sp. YIM S09857]|uniref:hypothetical protein n=1 Tax=Yinghuangia sp. YIM S09857 TaxID=3436929 RepID=UPI003F534D5D